MKLIYVIIRDADSESVIQALIENGRSVTRMASTGGFLRYGNVTLLIGVEPDYVNETIDILRAHCSPIKPYQHAATVFVVDMPVFTKV